MAVWSRAYPGSFDFLDLHARQMREQRKIN
jgi:hypothetical protein